MPGRTTKKSAPQRLKALSNAKLEEGEHWFAVAMPWWREFQVCQKAKNGPSVRNDSLIDKQFSSKAHKMAMLKPNLNEGSDFEFVPEAAWDVIAEELDFDWEIRREVIYLRSQQILQIESYPFAFKISYWTRGQTESKELVDEADRAVVVLGSRAHTLGQLLSEVWLCATDDVRRHFPQLLSCIDATSSSPSAISDNVRVCYHRRRTGDGELEWAPIEKMLKRSRLASNSLRLKPRAKKRRATEEEHESSEDQQSTTEDEEGETEYDDRSDDHSGLDAMLNTKLGDLRLDNRSEKADGTARLHEILIEERSEGAGKFDWPSLGVELQWRRGLKRGHLLDALDTMKMWCEARVLAARRNKVHVHYRGWEAKYDEWISRLSQRIAPPHSHVSKWRSALQKHALVQIGIRVPRRQHPKWRNATVLEVVGSSDGDQDQGVDDGAGLRVHAQVDGDDVWLSACDDMLSQPNSHCASKPLTQEERNLLTHDDNVETTEELPAENEDNGDEEQEDEDDGEEGDNTIDLIDHEGPQRPPRANNAAVERTANRSRMDLRSRTGPARNLTASFNQAQDQGRSSAGRTPARSRGRSRSQTSSDDTSPETVSPTRRLSADLQTRVAQVSNDLRSLQSSWDKFGESLMAFTQSLGPAQD